MIETSANRLRRHYWHTKTTEATTQPTTANKTHTKRNKRPKTAKHNKHQQIKTKQANKTEPTKQHTPHVRRRRFGAFVPSEPLLGRRYRQRVGAVHAARGGRADGPEAFARGAQGVPLHGLQLPGPQSRDWSIQLGRLGGWAAWRLVSSRTGGGQTSKSQPIQTGWSPSFFQWLQLYGFKVVRNGVLSIHSRVYFILLHLGSAFKFSTRRTGRRWVSRPMLDLFMPGSPSSARMPRHTMYHLKAVTGENVAKSL